MPAARARIASPPTAKAKPLLCPAIRLKVVKTDTVIPIAPENAGAFFAAFSFSADIAREMLFFILFLKESHLS